MSSVSKSPCFCVLCAKFFSPDAAPVLDAARRARLAAVGGLHYTKPFQGCVGGVSEPHVVQFPPFGGGEVPTHSGMVPKVQTTSVKNGENGVLWARWSTFWVHRCLARCMCSHVSPLFRASTRYLE